MGEEQQQGQHQQQAWAVGFGGNPQLNPVVAPSAETAQQQQQPQRPSAMARTVGFDGNVHGVTNNSDLDDADLSDSFAYGSTASSSFAASKHSVGASGAGKNNKTVGFNNNQNRINGNNRQQQQSKSASAAAYSVSWNGIESSETTGGGSNPYSGSFASVSIGTSVGGGATLSQRHFVYDVNKSYEENLIRSYMYDNVDLPKAMKEALGNCMNQISVKTQHSDATVQQSGKGTNTTTIIDISEDGVDDVETALPEKYKEKTTGVDGTADTSKTGDSSAESPDDDPNAKKKKSKNIFSQYLHKTWKYIRTTEFKWVKLAQLLCGAYIITVTFVCAGKLWIFGGARDCESGLIIDVNSEENTAKGIIDGGTFTRMVICQSNFQMFLLAISRFTGFSMYPAIICVFVTKCRSTQSIISKTPFNAFIVHDAHSLHIYVGWYIFWAATAHTFAHLLRIGLQGNIYLLTHHHSGITGLIAIIAVYIIVLPMGWKRLKDMIIFEIRKYAHYLFWLFCLVLTFHSPIQALPVGGFCWIVFPSLAIYYALDAFYAKCAMTERIDTVHYKILDRTGVELTMPVSERFQNNLNSGGYGYIMFEWIDKNQWHAFSLYENPLDKSVRHIFVNKLGDWTGVLHDKVANFTETARPCWLSGPFPSPYNNSVNFDNMILVAAGIGITPALSAVEAYREFRRVNLIWAVRDAAMLVFFLENAKLDEKGINLIFYTGKDPLPDTITNFNVHAHVEIIKKRPNMPFLIPNIIQFFDQNARVEAPKTKPLEFNPNKYKKTTFSMDTDDNKNESMFLNASDHPTKFQRQRQNRTREDELGISHHTTIKCGGKQKNLSKMSMDMSNHASRAKGLSRMSNATNKSCGISGGAACDLEKEIERQIQKEENEPTAEELWNNEKPDAREYVKNMPEERFETWGMAYCGGRSRLLEALVKERRRFGLPLQEEAFDW